MVEIFPVFLRIANSVLIAKYYDSFMMPKRKNRLNNALIVCFGVAYFISQYLIVTLLSRIGVSISNGTPMHIVSFVNFIVLFLSTFLISAAFFKKDLGMQIFLLCSFFSVQEISLFITFSTFDLLGRAGVLFVNFLIKQSVLVTLEETMSFHNIFTEIQYTIEMLLYAVINFMALLSIAKSFSYKKQSFSLTELLYLITPCLSGLSLASIIRAIIYKNDNNIQTEMFAGIPFAGFLIVLAGVIFLFSLIATVKLFQKMVELRIEEKENAVLQKQTQQIQEQIIGINSIYTEIRGMRHDMKSHISSIQVLLKAVVGGKQDVSKELDEYLGKLGDTLNKFEFAFQTGNSISDVIIHQKYLEAIDNEIDFTADFVFPVHLNIDVYDLAIILNNALENAFEACCKISPANRFIRLNAYTKGRMLFIEIANSFTDCIVLNELTALPISDKADKSAHGMGLPNIQRCARKYFGDIDFQITEVRNCKVFRLIVMLQGRD